MNKIICLLALVAILVYAVTHRYQITSNSRNTAYVVDSWTGKYSLLTPHYYKHLIPHKKYYEIKKAKVDKSVGKIDYYAEQFGDKTESEVTQKEIDYILKD